MTLYASAGKWMKETIAFFTGLGYVTNVTPAPEVKNGNAVKFQIQESDLPKLQALEKADKIVVANDAYHLDFILSGN